MSTQDEINHENAKTLFEAAVDFTLKEGDFVWSRFSAVMLAQSIIAVVFGQAFLYAVQDQNKVVGRIWPLVFSIALIIGGIMLCRLWRPITARSFSYQDLYLLSARELADNFLKITHPKFSENFLSKGRRFANEETIDFEIPNDKSYKPLPMDKLGHLSGRIAAQKIIDLFQWFYVFGLVLMLVYFGVLIAPLLP